MTAPGIFIVPRAVAPRLDITTTPPTALGQALNHPPAPKNTQRGHPLRLRMTGEPFLYGAGDQAVGGVLFDSLTCRRWGTYSTAYLQP